MSSKYQRLTGLGGNKFRRLTGVKRSTFLEMVDILRRADQAKKAVGGRKSKLSIEDRLLMALEYLREYRTYFHIAQSYGVSESTAYKICRWVEDTLIQDQRFALPGKRALLAAESAYDVVLIDATETPIERPKKNNGSTTPAKRSDTLSKARSSSTGKLGGSSA